MLPVLFRTRSIMTKTHRIVTPPRSSLRPGVDVLSVVQRYCDPGTSGHGNRSAELSVAIGARLGLGAERLEMLYLAATLHDIGKMAVAMEILGKPARLTAEEYTAIKTHSMVGYELLRSLHAPAPIPEVALQHHERIDGSGYPLGLKGEEILLEARIVSVADVFDAMTSQRPYTTPLPAEAAVAELCRMAADHQLDPQAVEACANYVLSRQPRAVAAAHEDAARMPAA
jgi:HD-GYP domain-containing protein (c-di-GMP phosphodiesterase class II)